MPVQASRELKPNLFKPAPSYAFARQAFGRHAFARKQGSDGLGGTGIVLAGLALAVGLLVWMAAGGGLPFDLGPRAEAGIGAQVTIYAEASALGVEAPQSGEPVLLAMQ